MDRKEFIRLIAQSGTQDVTITFKKGIDPDAFLYLFRRSKHCSPDSPMSIMIPGELTCLAIMQTRDWGHEANRSVKIRGLAELDENTLSNIGDDLERVEFPASHAAQGLMLKRQKSRDEAVGLLISSVLTPLLVAEIADWGLSVSGEFILVDEMPAVEFTITEGSNRLFTVLVDGWSGKMAVDGNFASSLYTDPKQLQDMIMGNLELKLDQITQAA
jgi:hypothetical protein